jgi:hypothetical protein
MSEYQYYEFLAVDRPLTATEQAEVRQLSTRARPPVTAPGLSGHAIRSRLWCYRRDVDDMGTGA